MITLCVTCAGDDAAQFDRDHWISVRLPLLREACDRMVCRAPVASSDRVTAA